MFDDARAFVTRVFLQSALALEYANYTDADDRALLTRLQAWSARMLLNETAAEGAFTQTFFVDTWGYGEAGRVARDQVTLIPKFRIAGEGAGGGSGEADAALGWFGDNRHATPQVLCEFKDIRSGLDAKQNRKGNTRSPVEQCLNYVRGARRGLFGNEPTLPWWGLVTDMNEFRLYWFDRPSQFLRFVIFDSTTGRDLLATTPAARFDRFLFSRLFARDRLIAKAGRPQLLHLVQQQWVRERKIEEAFYDHYRVIRERILGAVCGPKLRQRTAPETLRICQKLLDRFIFAFYCEDMGAQIGFPPQLLRDHFKTRSCEPTFDPDGDELWRFCQRLFERMNSGGALGQTAIPGLNGGLFAPDPALDALVLPNYLFAAPGQGSDEGALDRHQDTLLYLCARYNFAGQGDIGESLTLYSLGRIFEQSITELDDRADAGETGGGKAKISKRERDGVVYTPETIVEPIVELTLEPWFEAAKIDSGWAEASVEQSVDVLEVYSQRLSRLRILDPACGSGAFLISAYRRVLRERMSLETALAAGRGAPPPDIASVSDEILRHNLVGVDVNPAAVEIAKLSLWLHSARLGAPLAGLARTILCGDSLVGEDFYADGRREPPREQIRPLDWDRVVDDHGEPGFDVILGNPPYVSIQAVRKVDPAVADYLQAERGPQTFQSARTGSFDLCLPFIELGIRLLRDGGRMGFIAPSLWVINKHGQGLRGLIRRGRHLERWLDFKSYQVFPQATTYTALQIFTRNANPTVKIAVSPLGDIAGVDWSDPALVTPYDALDAQSEWLITTGAERALIDRLGSTCRRLGDPVVTRGILVGLQTSADSIYHLQRIGPNRYRSTGQVAEEIEIEDAIMRPLISGPDVRRFEQPEPRLHLLFPYDVTAGGARLFTPIEMARDFPAAWAHLRRWETELRARENGKHDDATWYRFGRNQNLDKQEQRKLIVAQLAPELRVCADPAGDLYLNNVRVNAVIAAEGVDQLFLLGVLNGEVANFVFKRIGKPKRGGFYEANKQFIAPLPVPSASAEQQAELASIATDLVVRWTDLRRLKREARDRLGVLERTRHPSNWLWPDLPIPGALEAAAPARLDPAARGDWAIEMAGQALTSRIEALQAQLQSQSWEVLFRDGELVLALGGSPVLARIYLDPEPGRLVASYWRWLMLSATSWAADKLCTELRHVPSDPTSPAARQFMERIDALIAQTAAITERQRSLDALLADLYGLTPAERALVKTDRAS
jgi:hypothetical protein